jgi:hypothetical protein
MSNVYPKLPLRSAPAVYYGIWRGLLSYSVYGLLVTIETRALCLQLGNSTSHFFCLCYFELADRGSAGHFPRSALLRRDRTVDQCGTIQPVVSHYWEQRIASAATAPAQLLVSNVLGEDSPVLCDMVTRLAWRTRGSIKPKAALSFRKRVRLAKRERWRTMIRGTLAPRSIPL